MWRRTTDIAKRSNAALRFASFLGRGKGRLRVLDHLGRVPAPRKRPDLWAWNRDTLAACWVGHSTVLLRVGNVTILTDPVFSKRVGIGLGLATAGPLRLNAPALDIRQLPPIDLVLISHAHFDHLDRPTLRRLPKKSKVFAAAHTTDLLEDLGFESITELQWGESAAVGDVRITAVPVKHWGARTFIDSHRGYNAYVIEDGARRVLYAADTAFTDSFRDIGPFDLGIVGIGAYDPYIAAHANPEQGWTMMNEYARAKHVAAVHHTTFKLSHEPLEEPLQRLLKAAGPAADRIVIREVGQTWEDHPKSE